MSRKFGAESTKIALLHLGWQVLPRDRGKLGLKRLSMHFAMRLGSLEAVEKLEINPLLPLRNVIRATLIFGEPPDASQRKVKVLIYHV
jgi:hypothetical protein